MKASTYLQIAFLVAQNSKCCSWKVGSVIEKGGRIISTGYNGSPAGAINCCDHAEDKGWLVKNKPTRLRQDGLVITKNVLSKEFRKDHSDWSKKNEIHAELNSILYAARNGLSIEGATMYVTLSPCEDCAKAIAQSGIRKLVFCETYDRASDDWYKIISDVGIEVHQVTKRELHNLNWNNIKDYCGE